MKKTLLLSLLLVFSSLFSFAQEVDVKIGDNGVKQLMCDFKLLDYPALKGVSLGCNVYPNGERQYILFLAIEKEGKTIGTNRKLLVKLGDGSIMEFVNPVAIAPTNSVVPYNITESEMKQLVSKKITKIRVEHDSGYIDQEIIDDVLSKELGKMYDKLQETLNSPFTQDITEPTQDDITEFTQDGARLLICNPILLDYNNMDGVSLSCIVSPNGDYTSYNLYLGVRAKNKQIRAGRKLLIKLSDGSILEFASYGEKRLTEDIIAYNGITESEMKQLVSKRITKIRVEHDTGYIDQDITDNKFSNALKQMYDKIHVALNAPKKDIYSDF